MHEYAIVRALMDRVEQEAQARKALRVHRVRIQLGEADLDVVPVPARWACTGCGREVGLGEVLQCPACGLPARLVAGDEILLERIEMEVP